MVKMAWEREGARVSKMGARKKKGVTWGKVVCHLFVDLGVHILWRTGPHAPQKVDILWRTMASAPQKFNFLWRILIHAPQKGEFLWRTSHGAPQKRPRWTTAH